MLIYLSFSFLIFIIGILGMIISQKHIIIMLISLELLLLSIIINFSFFSIYLDDLMGQLYCLFVLSVGAAESALGLSLVVVYYRLRGGIL